MSDVQASAAGTADSLWFLQMRGRFTLTGALAGRTVSDSGSGFFETYVPRSGGKPREGIPY